MITGTETKVLMNTTSRLSVTARLYFTAYVKKFCAESGSGNGRMVAHEFAYNSGTNEHFLTVDEIKELIDADVEH